MTIPLTGHWRLNQKLGTSQKEVLKLMGRKSWEISVIDKSEEDFNLFHFKRPARDGSDIHFFEKHVVLYLDSKVLKVLAAMMRIEVDKVKYMHKLVANNADVDHQDDEKQLGPCKSKTSWEENHEGHQGFTIRWFIKRGVLKVFHFINEQGRLQVEMEMQTILGKKAKCVKIYERLDFGPDMQRILDESPYKQFLLQ